MWVSLVNKLNEYVRAFGTTKLALLISSAIGLTSSTVRKVIKWILDWLWSKKIEPELDRAAYSQDKKPIEKKIIEKDLKVYDEAKKEYEKNKTISPETRKKLIDADIDFLNGGRRPK